MSGAEPAEIGQPGPARVRASEKAIAAALKAILDVGLPVDRVCVSGGRVEIHCGRVEAGERTKNDGGLKDW